MRMRSGLGAAFRFLIALSGTLLLPGNTHAADADAGWVDLFNHKDLAGWEQHSGKAKYYVADDCIVGETVTGTGNSFLCPVKSYGDFEMELDFQVDGGLNSGVQFRSDLFAEARTIKVNGKDVKLPADRLHGYQCEIDMDAARNRCVERPGCTMKPGAAGLIRRASRMAKRARHSPSRAGRFPSPMPWNHLRILCVGTSIKTWLNDVPRVDFNDAMTPTGRIGLQGYYQRRGKRYQQGGDENQV